MRAGLSVAAITLGTKGLGLLREAALAAEFGVGPVAEGLAFASLLPGLAGVLLGGVNGAFHSALAAVASRLPPDRRKALLADVWARVGPITAGVAAGVVLLAGPIVRATAPGLSPEVSQLAAAQLAAMAPSIWLSARVGLGFGALSASGCFWLPAASSALSSTTTLAAVGAHHCLAHLLTPHSGAVLVASATSLGAGMQWGMQELVRRRSSGKTATADHRSIADKGAMEPRPRTGTHCIALLAWDIMLAWRLTCLFSASKPAPIVDSM